MLRRKGKEASEKRGGGGQAKSIRPKVTVSRIPNQGKKKTVPVND